MLTQRYAAPRKSQVIVTGESHLLHKSPDTVAGLQGDASSTIVCYIYDIIYLTAASVAGAR
jgi:hypothetical protein